MPAIQVDGLSKMYRIYARPKDRLIEYLVRGRKRHQQFWALRDVTFQVPAGSTFGLMGENGSGKSTLLQLLAGTLTPTSGVRRVRGRVSAILELGAGFNPDFTGRENVLMTGAIMGIGRREMAERLEDVIAFAEIGDFIDRPLRMYSTGMYLRLAFAAATTVDPDVLIVDEALSVGDEYFQKRCIDRIETFRKAGRTIVFCSHNSYQLRVVCEQAIWLRAGRVAMMGDTLKVVTEYESYLRGRMAERCADPPASGPATGQRGPRPAPWITDISLIVNGRAGVRHEVQTGDDLAIAVSYEVPAPPTAVHVGVRIFRNDGIVCYGTGTHLDGLTPPPTSGCVVLRFPDIQLLAGEYYLSAHLLDETGLHHYEERRRACSFRIYQPFIAIGLCRLRHEWDVGAAPKDAAQLHSEMVG